MKVLKPLCLLAFITILIPNDKSLGRDNDPKIPSDISTASLLYRKVVWSTLSLPGQRFMSSLIFPESSIAYMDVDNAVAFTIDDGFCGVDNPNGCMINEVRDLFNKYDAKATFFITGNHCNYVSVDEVQLLLNDGHELANHNMYDYPYDQHSKEDFESDLDSTQNIISQFTPVDTKWYRAPHAKLSKEMQTVIDSRGMVHIISDSFANDTAIPDSKWIAEFVLKSVQPGSIIVLHMPERGVREWCYEAMELVLQGLKEKNLDILTLTELEKLQ